MSKRPVNVEVKPKYKDEPFEKMVRRFTKKVKKERIIETYRERMYYEKPSIEKVKESRRRKKVLEKLRREIEKKLR